MKKILETWLVQKPDINEGLGKHLLPIKEVCVSPILYSLLFVGFLSSLSWLQEFALQDRLYVVR